MRAYVLSRDAELDLDGIWEYIARDSVDAADNWLDRLYDAFLQVSQSPGIGHSRKDLTSLPVLFWPAGRYLILYRLQDNVVEIVAVTQGGRDVPLLLVQRDRET